MNAGWTSQGAIAAGGTVIAGAADVDGRLLIATSAGVFRREDERWLPLANQPSAAFLQAFAAADNFICLGGASLLVYSADGGRTWNRGQISALDQPVTCLALSPNFAQDRALLAGTDGAGILRSTDGGKYWRYASFGLQDFSVTALACAPTWDDREVVFASAAEGLYRSPNGGRAWKYAGQGLEGCVVLSIVPSPNFVDDGVVFVGTEEHGVFRSCDGGFTWAPCAVTLEPGTCFPAVNALWVAPDGSAALAGLDDGTVLRSRDGGASWVVHAQVGSSVLCLFGQTQRLYAGTADDGLLASADGGRAWTADPALAARQFTSLHSGARGDLFAVGGSEGIWRSGDRGYAWELFGDFDAILLSAAFERETGCALAGTAQGLFRADESGCEWAMVAPLPDVTALAFSPAFSRDGRAWAGTWGGQIYASDDGGRGWQAFPPPPTGTPVIAVGVVSDPPEAERLAAVSYNPRSQILTLWRWAGDGWRAWLESPSATPTAQVVAGADAPVAGADAPVAGADAPGETIFGLGNRCWRWVSGAWHCILKTDLPILRLLRHPAGGLVALTADSILYSSDFADWAVLHAADGALHDLALLPSEGGRAEAWVLRRGGGLLRGSIPE
jgi:photosystem II stability/assembly factor-like uncharacterized protein